MTSRRSESGQASVELALLMPVLVLIVLVVVQVGTLMRDRVVVVNNARAAARIGSVAPSESEVIRELSRIGIELRADQVRLHGDTSPGGLATVEVRANPTLVPIVGRFLGDVAITESLSFRVEGGEPNG